MFIFDISFWSIIASRPNKMDFIKINAISSAPGYLPTEKMSKLIEKNEYYISKLRWVKTKFGKRIVAELDDKFQVFLPYRIVKYCEENSEWFQNLMTAVEEQKNIYLRYLGGPSNQCEFTSKLSRTE